MIIKNFLEQSISNYYQLVNKLDAIDSFILLFFNGENIIVLCQNIATIVNYSVDNNKISSS